MPKICPVCEATYSDSNVFCPVDGTTLHVVDLHGGLIGSVVADRYLVTDLLGEGGMGKVYLARHVRLPQQAAIKVLHPDMVRDPAAVARFNREASNASRIDDEHVARVYDFGEVDGGMVYLAMEFVQGRTLKAVIAVDGALNPRRAAEIVRQIAQGLDAAHRLKIIHRDLKPDNVLVTQTADGGERVKVVDFGIAKAFGSEDGGLTKTGFIVGTPEFMSPEQLLGGALDARSDVYALALVAFQCLTGELPFPGNTPEQAMTARLASAPQRLLDVASSTKWPAAVQGVFDAALSRDMEKRPASAGAFATRLTKAVEEWMPDGKSRPATPTRAVKAAKAAKVPRVKAAGSPWPTRRRWPRRVVLLALLAGGFWYLNDSRPNDVRRWTATARTLFRRGQRSAEELARAGTAVLKDAPSASPTSSAPATESAPSGPNPDNVALDSLSRVLGAGVVDASTARSIADALRAIAPRLESPGARVRAWFRVIDASTLAGDASGACSALREAEQAASTTEQKAEATGYGERMGCK
jgi:eukaryotic-like serine/threonine-protein kinase